MSNRPNGSFESQFRAPRHASDDLAHILHDPHPIRDRLSKLGGMIENITNIPARYFLGGIALSGAVLVGIHLNGSDESPTPVKSDMVTTTTVAEIDCPAAMADLAAGNVPQMMIDAADCQERAEKYASQ